MEEKIESFKNIHYKLFPKATPHSQILQLNEELKELELAETNREFAEELGDVLVVAISLLRFPQAENIGKFIINREFYKQSSKQQNFRLKLIEKAIDKCKQRVSEKRYAFVNGVYKRDK